MKIGLLYGFFTSNRGDVPVTGGAVGVLEEFGGAEEIRIVERVTLTPFPIRRRIVGWLEPRLFSLAEAWFGAGVSSKRYEHINLGLPVLGAVPDGDTTRIVRDEGLGLCVRHDDLDGLGSTLDRFATGPARGASCRAGVRARRAQSSREYRIRDVDGLLRNFFGRPQRMQTQSAARGAS